MTVRDLSLLLLQMGGEGLVSGKGMAPKPCSGVELKRDLACDTRVTSKIHHMAEL